MTYKPQTITFIQPTEAEVLAKMEAMAIGYGTILGRAKTIAAFERYLCYNRIHNPTHHLFVDVLNKRLDQLASNMPHTCPECAQIKADILALIERIEQHPEFNADPIPPGPIVDSQRSTCHLAPNYNKLKKRLSTT